MHPMESRLLTAHTQTQGVGDIVAAVLRATSRPLTRVLEDLSGLQLTVHVLDSGDRRLTGAEHYRLDAGPIISGQKTVDETGEDVLELIIKVSSGDLQTKAESLSQDDFIPWKRGVSL